MIRTLMMRVFGVLVALSLVTPAIAQDNVARGLAIQAMQKASTAAVDPAARSYAGAWHDRIEKLRRAAGTAAASGPEQAPVSPVGAVTIASASDATLTKVYIDATLFDYAVATGGHATLTASGAWYFPVASIAPSTAGQFQGGAPYAPLTADLMAWGWEVSIQTDVAGKVQFRLTQGATIKAVRVLVDGQYVTSKDPLALAYSGENDVIVTLDGQPHTVTLQAQTQVGLRSIAVPPNASIAKPRTYSDRAIVLATGDSYGEGQGETYPGLRAWPKTLGRLMGWSDVRQVAVGGTGVLNAGSGRSTIRDQIARWLTINSDIAGADVDVVLFAPGYNDAYLLRTSVITQAALQAEYLADLKLVRALCPNALIVDFGSSAGRTGPDTYVLQAEATALAAYTAWADPHGLYIPISADTPPWLAGDGMAVAFTGALSAATSGTLTQAWSQSTGTHKIVFSDGSIQTGTFTFNSTAVTWPAAVTASAKAATYDSLRGNSEMLVNYDSIHPTDLGHMFYARRAASAIRAGLALPALALN